MEDTTPPVITLIGDANITHLASTTYIDQWSELERILLMATPPQMQMDQWIPTYSGHVYEITYSKTDAAGNTAEPVQNDQCGR